MRTQDDFIQVRRLVDAGMNDCAISRATGVPRTTVLQWRNRPPRRFVEPSDCTAHDYSTLPSVHYAYLLGLYLGDGCISRMGRVWRLRIALDTRYPDIIESCRLAIDALMPGQHAHVAKQKSNYVVVGLYSKHWPCVFPQHAPGRKHLRPIVLEPWQQAHVDTATEEFVRGLIHSDGCRVVANDRGVASIRYHFTNHSTDIRNLFCAALDRLGIPWTQNSRYVIAELNPGSLRSCPPIQRKAATARLDQFIGPKT